MYLKDTFLAAASFFLYFTFSLNTSFPHCFRKYKIGMFFVFFCNKTIMKWAIYFKYSVSVTLSFLFKKRKSSGPLTLSGTTVWVQAYWDSDTVIQQAWGIGWTNSCSVCADACHQLPHNTLANKNSTEGVFVPPVWDDTSVFTYIWEK